MPNLGLGGERGDEERLEPVAGEAGDKCRRGWHGECREDVLKEGRELNWRGRERWGIQRVGEGVLELVDIQVGEVQVRDRVRDRRVRDAVLVV